jgi:hypothetical protein
MYKAINAVNWRMSKWLFFLTVMLLAAVNGHSQIQVSQEPRHHKVLENEWVRVLDVHVPPHDTTLMHKHSTPSVFVLLSRSKTGSEVLIEPGKPLFTAGDIWFEGFYDKPRVHRVWNEDTVEFHVMDIELLHKPSTTTGGEVSVPYSQSLFEAKPVHAFRVILGPGEGFTTEALSTPAVIVGLSGPSADGVVNDRPFTKKGDCLFIPAGSTLYIANKSANSDQQFALFYLK